MVVLLDFQADAFHVEQPDYSILFHILDSPTRWEVDFEMAQALWNNVSIQFLNLGDVRYTVDFYLNSEINYFLHLILGLL
jgi:hypothetical protein